MLIHPPMLLMGYMSFVAALRLRRGGADHRPARRRLAALHPPLDAGGLDDPDVRAAAGRVVGLSRAGLGRLLGLGPGRERGAAAVADGDRLPALDDGAGAARHAQGLESGADHRDLRALDLRHLRGAQRHHQLGALVRLLSHRAVLPRLPGGRAGRSRSGCSSTGCRGCSPSTSSIRSSRARAASC